MPVVIPLVPAVASKVRVVPEATLALGATETVKLPCVKTIMSVVATPPAARGLPDGLLGVTVLTSSTNETLAEIGCEADTEKQVVRLAQLAEKSGLRGLVCSPLEIAALRRLLPAHIQLVTPGIRTGAEKADDQKRTLSPREAMAAGANWLVVGRPIYAAENPRAAAEKILASIA